MHARTLKFSSLVTAVAFLGLACSAPSGAPDPAAAPPDSAEQSTPVADAAQPEVSASAELAGLSDDAIVSRAIAFAEGFAEVIGEHTDACTEMGDGLEARLDANKDLMLFSKKMRKEDPERKERIAALVEPKTDAIIGPHMDALNACKDNPKVSGVLARMLQQTDLGI